VQLHGSDVQVALYLRRGTVREADNDVAAISWPVSELMIM